MTWMPTRRARKIVAATVVAPACPAAIARGRSRVLHFAASTVLARCSSSVLLSPTLTRPSRTAIVAGSAPASRTASSIAKASAALRGLGMPWQIRVELQRHHATAFAQGVLHPVGGVDRHEFPRVCAARSGLRLKGVAS